jgi:hypothetical protein
MTWAATTGPIPNWPSSWGASRRTSLSSWTSSSAASRSQGSARRAVERIANTVADSSTLRRRVAQPGAGLQKLSQRQGPEPGALVTSAWRAEMASGPERDRLPAGGQQHSDGFPVSAAARLAEAHTGERLPGRRHRVDIVALHPATTCRPLGAINLNDPLAASVQRRGQSGTEAAGAFDGPQPRAMAPPEADQPAGSQPDRPEPSNAPGQRPSRRPPPRCGCRYGCRRR